jgi:protein involved in polysaccharide export with SLBB domain
MYKNNAIKILLTICISLLGFINSYSQDILKGKDLSQLKVEMISASDLNKLKSQLSSAGLSLDQAEQLAISKGMSPLEASKLKLKLSTSNAVSDSKTSEANSSIRENSEQDQLDNSKVDRKVISNNPLIFGSELYSGSVLSFEPNLKMATPVNYILGPEDQIQISVFGTQEYNGIHTITPDGTVNIPNIGEIKLLGLSIEAATQKLKNVMGNSVYTYLKTGGAKIVVTLSKIRTISITIIGSSKPGNYKVSSLSSVFNALFIAGGPSSLGSFREIELIRNNKLERKIDLYHFLIEGSQADNVSLKDNDVIRIPTYKTRIEIKGEVKRPGIFEVLPGENLSNILTFASGFTDNAYMGSLKIFQRNEKERQIQDLISSDYNRYKPQSGDIVEVSKILDRYKNRVTINGAVYRPNQYELTSNLHVSDLIGKADGLKQDAFLERGQILRLKEDLTKSILSFDVKKALSGDPLNNILLQKEDEIYISSINELKDKFQVTIQGEVRSPGKYNFVEKLTLKDLILQSGGFTDAAFKKIEIARILKRDSLTSTDNKASIILKTEINELDLSISNSANIPLEAMDVVTVRRIAGYLLPESVIINGQIQYPGPYTLGNSSERVSDILKRAGGFSPNAYPEGAFLKRFKSVLEIEKAKEAVEKLQKSTFDSTVKTQTDILRNFDKIPLNMGEILKNPGSLEDIVLKYGDEIYIPKFDGQVKINGEVLFSTQVSYQSSKGFSDYIDAAGGYTSSALKSKAFIVYANGMASSTKKFMFFKSYPKVKPGSEIVIPKKREKRASSTAEIIGIASALASLAGVTIALLKL